MCSSQTISLLNVSKHA